MSFSIRKQVSTQRFTIDASKSHENKSQANNTQVSKLNISNINKKTQNIGLDMCSLQKRGERFIYSPPEVSKPLYESEELFFDRAKNRWITIPISKKN